MGNGSSRRRSSRNSRNQGTDSPDRDVQRLAELLMLRQQLERRQQETLQIMPGVSLTVGTSARSVENEASEQDGENQDQERTENEASLGQLANVMRQHFILREFSHFLN